MKHTILNLLLVMLLLSACQPVVLEPVVLEPQEADLQMLEQGIIVDTTQVPDATSAEWEKAVLLEANRVLAYRYVEEIWNLGNMDTAAEILAEDFVDYSRQPSGTLDESTDKLRQLADAASFHASGKRYQLDGQIVTEDSMVLRITVLVPENGEELHEATEDIILLRVKDGQITERHVARFYWE